MNQPAHIKRAHIVGEKLGLWVAGPLAIYAGATTKKLPTWLRIALVTSGIGTMVLDAYLLRYYQKNGR